MVRSAVDTRPSPLAGKWYPGRADALTAMLDRFLRAVPPRSFDGKLLGLLAPHAGIQYSGPVAAHAYALGAALAETLKDRRALIVASSDLSHFYPQDIANQLDTTLLDCVAAMDVPRLVEYNEQGKAFACGYGAIATTINATRALGAQQAQIVGHGTSGDVTGDVARVVGYGAAAFYN